MRRRTAGVVPRARTAQGEDWQEHVANRSRFVSWRCAFVFCSPRFSAGVYLGTKQAAANREALRALGIDRIVNVGGGPCLFADVDYWEIHLSDKRDADLLSELSDATHFVHESVEAGKSVLCHCQGGTAWWREVESHSAWQADSVAVRQF